MNKFYLTTPLYYVNSKPHIGHSYTQIACDALARYKRLQLGRENVFFLTGTDEHGQKIARAAQAAGKEPQAFTDEISQTFRDLWKTLNVDTDDFIRTTEDRHKKAVGRVWEELKGKKVGGEDVLYRHTYDGWYCVSCETFHVEGPAEAGGPVACPDCKKPLERMKEDTYFFRMSAYQERLMKDLREDKLRVLPETRKNEVLGFLEHNKLADLSVSRPKSRLAWGIPIPFDPEHVTYVWFDALINYVSAAGYGSDPEKLAKWWPADVHVIGKDIIRHHAVIWPILLYALDLELPRTVFAHGWWVVGGEKMSKSLGNAVDPLGLAQKYGIDAYRYFLLREVPFGSDGTFSEEALILRFNTDLANDIGNLLHRSLTMCEKYFNGEVPASRVSLTGGMTPPGRYTLDLKVLAAALPEKLDALMGRLAFSEALQEIWALISRANKFIEESAPWTLAKEGKTEDLAIVIGTLHEVLRIVAQAVWPFIPATAEGLWAQLGIEEPITKSPLHARSWGYFKDGGHKVAKGAPLFPRIDTGEEKKGDKKKAKEQKG
ncbi:MAG TPA: methionine--tRNA ligase [Candidatus Eisenbacteria bacterium]|jgi:methionyl-tRNA synthetase|nr:methionine--tRNA ligase [Candidatus Eisenbacteria bacterium]